MPLPEQPAFIAHRREIDGAEQSVTDHLRSVAALARSFSRTAGLGSYGEIAGLLHDFGKFSTAFQRRINGVDPARVDHSTAGAQLIWNRLSVSGPQGIIAGQLLALCVASHHGGLIDCITSDGMDRFSMRMSKADEETHSREAEKRGASIVESAERLLREPALIGGLQRILEDLSRRERERSTDGAHNRFALRSGLLLRFLFSCLIDADRTDTANFEQPHLAASRRGAEIDWQILALRLDEHLAALGNASPIDEIRREVSDRCRAAAARPKGLFTLSVPTGGGKTLASLRFALHHALRWGCSRVVYVAPYTSILDQNAQVARDIFEQAKSEYGSIVLEHHSNLVPDEDTDRAKLLAENWDALCVFTTMVQFLETVFGGGTRGARRFHQLADAVVIFDEIQTLPVRTVHLFCNAVEFLLEQCRATVLLSTATQPLLGEVDRAKGALAITAANEVIEDVPGLYRTLKRTEIVDRRRPGGWSIEAVAQLARDAASRAGSCLVVVNTRRSARELYRQCLQYQDLDVAHLSTSMCPAHRTAVLTRVIKALSKGAPARHGREVVCVSTQLIEAGVDIDFGSVVRFAAGLDSVAQAAGRCNRHGLRTHGDVTIVNPTDENLARLEEIRAARDAGTRVLDEFRLDPGSLSGDLLSPKAMDRYFRYWFFDRRREMDYPIRTDRDDTILNLLSLNTLNVGEYGRQHDGRQPPIFWRQAFASAARAFHAIVDDSDGVIVPYGEGVEIIGQLATRTDPLAQRAVLRRAQRYAVGVFPETLRRLVELGAAREASQDLRVFYLDERYYSSEPGLSEEPLSPAHTLII